MSQCFDVIFYVLFLLPSFKPEFFFENFKFEFYNLIRLSYLIFCCKRTKSWTSSLRKSVLILTRSDFEEVNVVTCWDKKMWFVSLNSCVQKWSMHDKGFLSPFFRAIKTFWNFSGRMTGSRPEILFLTNFITTFSYIRSVKGIIEAGVVNR